MNHDNVMDGRASELEREMEIGDAETDWTTGCSIEMMSCQSRGGQTILIPTAKLLSEPLVNHTILD